VLLEDGDPDETPMIPLIPTVTGWISHRLKSDVSQPPRLQSQPNAPAEASGQGGVPDLDDDLDDDLDRDLDFDDDEDEGREERDERATMEGEQLNQVIEKVQLNQATEQPSPTATAACATSRAPRRRWPVIAFPLSCAPLGWV
jgi:hypothetical protein